MERKIQKQLTNGQWNQFDEYVPLPFAFEGTTTDGNPASGHLRYNDNDPTAVTFIFISNDDVTGMDVTTVHSKLKSGDSFRVQGLDDELQSDLFNVSGVPISASGYFKIPVTHEQSSAGDDFTNEDLGISIYQGGVTESSKAENPFIFDEATADADPGAGKLRLNNAADASSTKIFIDIENSDGLDITSKLEKIGIGSVIQIQEKGTPANSVIFDVNADLIDNSGYFEIPVTFKVSGSGADLTDVEDIIVFFHTSTEKFIDSLFRIRDDADKSKQVAFDISPLASATTRTYGTPDYDGRLEVASAPITKTPAGSTETIDWRKGRGQILDLGSAGADITLTFIGAVSGQSYILQIIQGATDRDVILPDEVLIPGGSFPTTLDITITEDAIDTLTMFFNGTNFIAQFGENYG